MKPTRHDVVNLGLLMLVFWIGVLRHIDLPGFYFDAVNPDYLAARTLFPALPNPVWALPFKLFPILGNLYHGVQNYYLDLVIFKIAGISVASIRLAQAAFGAGIVGMLYLLVLESGASRLIAFGSALLLATDIGFLASFRTQFYIILGGEMWLFMSLFALWRGQAASYLLSGIFMGLAIYGYFVLGFMLPAMALFAWRQHPRHFRIWIAGFVIGMLPYVAGYMSIAASIGLSNFPGWLHGKTHTLAPLSSALTLWGSVQYVLNCAQLAISNAGNELMIFTQPVSGTWGSVKCAIFVAVLALLACRFRTLRRADAVLLPVTYLIVCLAFGARLWAHHFSVLLPLAYLMLGILLVTVDRTVATRRAVLVGLSILVAGNLYQANHFHRVLDATGGAGKSSDALTELALEARHQSDVLYVFPDWGFFASFALLTENHVPYIIDIAAAEQEIPKYREMKIAFWSQQDIQKYRDLLTRAGIPHITETIYRQRDGKTAFYVLTGSRVEP